MYKDSGTLDKTHLRFFTKKSIIRMFEELNYRIIKMEGINKHTPRKYRLVNFLCFNLFSDSKYHQFVCIATPKMPIKN